MRGLPQTLPQGLYDAAARRGRPASGLRPAPAAPPAAAIPRQFSGTGRVASPIQRPAALARPFSPQTTGVDWAISPQDKANFDSIFATVDKSNRGFIDGEQALEFFSNARLSEDVLAQIWDLADINSEGQLNRDEFAVAMYLIRQQRGKRENQRGTLPPTLPANLVPPSMRRQTAPPPQSTAPAFDNAANITQSKSAADDLFGLDVLSPPAPAAAQLPQSTGGSNGPFQTPTSPISRASPQPPASNFKPFIPSSSFGQSLAPQATGFGQASSPAPKAAQPSDDLLGDAEPEASSRNLQDSMELGNLSNQVSTLSTQMQDVSQKRAASEQQISQTSQQKRDFEVRLAQLRAMYEAEVKDVRSLEQQYSQLRAETSKLQQELTTMGASYQEIQAQHQQLSAQLEAEKQENLSLKERTRQVNAEINQLKPQLEKLKSDARQQKGMVAINKKQLATSEAERDRVRSEMDTTNKELEEMRSSTPQNVGTPAAAVALSPALSTASQHTNPFFRRTASQSPGPNLSPQSTREIQKPDQSGFDNVFGPSFTAPSTSTPPPQSSFRTESPAPAHLSAQNTGFSARSFDSSNLRSASASPFPQESNLNQSMATATDNGPSHVSPDNLSSHGLPASTEPDFGSGNQASSGQGSQDNLQSSQGASSSHLGLGAAAAAAGGLAVGHQLGGFSGFDEPRGDGQANQVLEATSERQPSGADHPYSSSQLNGSDLDASWTAVSHENSSSDHMPTPTATQEIPGAFPPETPFAPEPSTTANEVTSAPRDESFDELFGGPAHKRSHSENVSDFDQAFAAMKTGESDKATNPNANGFGSSEFPPIQEIEDSDTSDSEAGMGFEDDFAPATNKGKAPQSESLGTESKSAQDAFPAEFSGLLPSRTDPTTEPHSVDSTTGAPIIGGQPVNTVAAPAGANSAFNFEDAFAGVELAEGKESDGEDEFDSSDFKHNEFDPTFSSPAPSKAATFDSTNHTAQPSASDDFFNFESNVASQAPSIPQHPFGDSSFSQSTSTTAAAPAISHDWDAMFAGLDGVKETTGDEEDDAFEDKTKTGGLSAPERPALGRILTTEHDDPLLKNMVAMGFPRDKALEALEKYDYNIDKVCLLLEGGP